MVSGGLPLYFRGYQGERARPVEDLDVQIVQFRSGQNVVNLLYQVASSDTLSVKASGKQTGGDCFPGRNDRFLLTSDVLTGSLESAEVSSGHSIRCLTQPI